MSAVTTIFAASTDLPFWGGEATTSYKLLLLVHIVAVVAAFGPLFLSTALNREAIKRSGESARAFASIPMRALDMTLPALIVAIVSGMGLVADSQERWTFAQAWISAAFAVVIVDFLLVVFMLRPAQRRLIAAVEQPESDERSALIRSAKAVIGMSTGLVHVSLIVIVGLMVWKPGA